LKAQVRPTNSPSAIVSCSGEVESSIDECSPLVEITRDPSNQETCRSKCSRVFPASSVPRRANFFASSISRGRSDIHPPLIRASA